MPRDAKNNRKMSVIQTSGTVAFKFSAFGVMLPLLNLTMASA
jgi:hypothetical protein